MMQCKECREHLPQYLMDELDQSVCLAVQSHLESECSECNDELVNLSEVIGQLATLSALRPAPSVDREQIWASIKEKMEAPLDDTPVVSVVRETTSSRSGQRLTLWSAVLLSLAGGFLVMSSIRMAVDPRNDVFGYNFFRNEGDEIAARVRPEAGSENPEISNLKSVALHRVDDPQKQCGTIVFDPYESQIHLFLSGLPALTTGQTYVFWFCDANGRWLSPTRLLADRGDVGQVIDVPTHDTPLTSAITIEGSVDDGNSKRRVAVITGDSVFDDGNDA